MTITAELTDLNEDHKVRLTVAVPEEEVRSKAQRAVRALGRNVRLPGFRPGKAPAGLVVNAVGRDAVIERMLRDSLGEWYEKALDATGVTPIDEPELDLPEVSDEGPIQFTATVRRRPTAALGQYRGLEVERPDVEVTDAMVDAELDRLRRQLGRLQPVERPAVAGDFVTMDFDGSVDGAPEPSATGRDYTVELGAGRLVAGFDEHLIGRSAGEPVSFDLAYPEDDQRGELAGKTLHFDVALTRVQERVLPDLGDAFASDVAGFETLDELRADLRERLSRVLGEQADEQFRRRVIDAALADATVDVPALMVERRVENILHDTSHQLPKGITLEDYVRAQGRTMDQARGDLAPDAEMSIRRELLVEAVIAAEGIEVTDEEIEARVTEEATAAGRDPRRIMRDLRRSGNIEVLREDLARDRAVAVMVDTAVALTPAEAEAKGKLWTPESARPQAPSGGLWTPPGADTGPPSEAAEAAEAPPDDAEPAPAETAEEA